MLGEGFGLILDLTLDLDILPVSGFTGANIKDRLDNAVFPHYEYVDLSRLV